MLDLFKQLQELEDLGIQVKQIVRDTIGRYRIELNYGLSVLERIFEERATYDRDRKIFMIEMGNGNFICEDEETYINGIKSEEIKEEIKEIHTRLKNLLYVEGLHFNYVTFNNNNDMIFFNVEKGIELLGAIFNQEILTTDGDKSFCVDNIQFYQYNKKEDE